MLCDYGCGKPAKYTLPNGTKCCSANFYSCPAWLKKIKEVRPEDKEEK